MFQAPFLLTIDNEDDMLLIRDAFEQRVNDYQARIDEMAAEIASLSSILDRYKKKIMELDQPVKRVPERPMMPELFPREVIIEQPKEQLKPIKDDYAPGMTKAAQAEYALRQLKKPATTREILEFLLTKEPDLLAQSGTTFDKFQKALAATLYQKAVVKNTFSSARNLTTDSVTYSLLDWGHSIN